MASIRKLPSGKYRVRWRDSEGSERGATLRTKKDALVKKAEVEVEASRGSYHDPRLGRQTLRSYMKQSLEASIQLSSATRSLYEREARLYVYPSLGSRQIGSLQPGDVRGLYADLVRRGVGADTIGVVHRIISRTLALAWDDGIIPANPAARAKPPRARRKPVRVLTTEELFALAIELEARQAIIWLARGSDPEMRLRVTEGLQRAREAVEAADSPGTRLKAFAAQVDSLSTRSTGYGVLAVVMAFSGLRFGEAAALRKSRVHLGPQPWLEVVEAINEVDGHLEFSEPKTRRSRSVPIHATLASLLEERIGLQTMLQKWRESDAAPTYTEADRIDLEFHGHPELIGQPKPWVSRNYVDPVRDDPLLFTTKAGYPLSRTRFRSRVWVPAVERAGLEPPPNPYDLRHTNAALLIEEGAHPKLIQERLGHSSIRTTLDVYGHLMPSLEDSGAGRLELLLG